MGLKKTNKTHALAFELLSDLCSSGYRALWTCSAGRRSCPSGMSHVPTSTPSQHMLPYYTTMLSPSYTTDCPPTPHTHHQRRTAPARCADPPAHQPGACPGGVQDADESAKAVQRRPCAGHPRARRDPKHRDTHEATRGPCRVVWAVRTPSLGRVLRPSNVMVLDCMQQAWASSRAQ